MRLIIVLLGVQLLMLASNASAVIITTDTVQVGGVEYTTEFTVDNSSGTIPIEEFTIFFEADKYFALFTVSVPSVDWDPLVIQPDPQLGMFGDGLFDALAFSTASGVGVGDSLSGFVVGYSLLAGSSIGPWYFEILQPDPFAFLSAGTTISSAVSEPSVILLLAGGLMSIGVIRRRKNILEIAKHLDAGSLSVDRKHGGVA